MFDTIYLWALIPLALLNLGLVIYCLTDWLKRKDFRYPGRWFWLIVFALFQYIGPVLYIVFVKNHDSNQV